MPALPDKTFRHTAANGEVSEFRSRAHVTTDGVFSFTLPDDMLSTARQLDTLNTHWHLTHDSRRKVWTVEAPTLAIATAGVEAIQLEHMKCETTREDVIAYRYRSGVHYWQRSDGSIYANGYLAGSDATGEWRGAGHSHFEHERRQSYEIGFAAFALVRSTHVRPSGTKVEFHRWNGAPNLEYNDPRARLNAFVRLHCGTEIAHNRAVTVGKDFTVIPYTPEAAEFFYGVLISLCKIDDRLSRFFADQSRVTAAIQSGQLNNLLA